MDKCKEKNVHLIGNLQSSYLLETKIGSQHITKLEDRAISITLTIASASAFAITPLWHLLSSTVK